jgi:redox-sensitive bicupin YhaK (pirin superfamily)
MPFLAGTGGAECEVAAGTLGSATAGAPPPHSWAADAANEVGVFHITLPPGGTFELPAALHGAAINRAAYIVEGPTEPRSLLFVGGAPVPGGRGTLVLDASQPCLFENQHPLGTADVHALVLQGRPIAEPVVQVRVPRCGVVGCASCCKSCDACRGSTARSL